MATMSKKLTDLARLAADERTPEHERVAAAMALAKPQADAGDVARWLERRLYKVG